MLNSIYTLSFILSFCYLYIMITVFRNRISVHFPMLFACILITNFGYLQMTGSDTLKMALAANQTIYLGSSFTPIFLFFCIADLVNEKLSVWLRTLLIVFGSAIFFIASSPEAGGLYYKSLTLVNSNGATLLVKEYGPLHMLYIADLVFSTAGGCYLIIKSLFRRRVVSYKNSILTMVAVTISILFYGIEKLSGLNIPLIPIGYMIAQTIVLVLLTRISMYDVAAISSDVLLETSIGGIICFDTKGHFLGADADAYDWFPEVHRLNIDSGFNKDDSDFFKQVWKWIFGHDTETSAVIEREGKFYLLEHSIRQENKFKKVHVIFMRDETESMTYNQMLESTVEEKTRTLRKMQNDIILGMASTVEDRDSNTGGHILRTSEVMNIFVKYLKRTKFKPDYPPRSWNNLIKAAPLHDFGKIGVPDVILNKPGRFTPDEYEVMQTHAAKGAVVVARILKNSDDTDFKAIAENVAHYHHEKWDGSGYPEKLAGTDIPFEARVMALADVFDALVSKRVYKDSLSYDTAFKIIEDSSGTHFDPDLCREFLKCRTELEALYDGYAKEQV